MSRKSGKGKHIFGYGAPFVFTVPFEGCNRFYVRFIKRLLFLGLQILCGFWNHKRGVLLMKQQTTTQQPIYDARTLGRPKMAILGLQHMFAMFGATILVPILTGIYFSENGASYGLSIQVTLLFAGLGTLFFHLCSKFQIPAFLGSSFAFLGGFKRLQHWIPVFLPACSMSERLPYACGGMWWRVSCTWYWRPLSKRWACTA